jgi:LAGLIDADG-like domain
LAERPAWPPTKEDLERLYLVEGLSAAKVAKAYGLNYASKKTAESTVLFHLRKNGISRRGKTDHLRKPPQAMVDGWVERYGSGESLSRIAGEEYSPVTVWNHLRRRGVKLRDKIEAQIKAVSRYERRPFDGPETERAYIVGFTRGDCQAVRHGRAIRVRSSTTHRGFTELFEATFGKYGHIRRYPSRSRLVGFEWHVEVDLDGSFSFLLIESVGQLDEFFTTPVLFFSFLSGFFDAEGSIYYHKKGNWGGFELSISNTLLDLLAKISVALETLGYHSKLVTLVQQRDRLGYEKPGQISRIIIWRREVIHQVLGRIELRHPERKAKARIALVFLSSSTKSEIGHVLGAWNDLRAQIRQDVKDYREEARLACLGKGHLTGNRGPRLQFEKIAENRTES